LPVLATSPAAAAAFYICCPTCHCHSVNFPASNAPLHCTNFHWGTGSVWPTP